MSRRIFTEWLCYFIAIYAGFYSSFANGVSARNPPLNPAAAVEAQAKFFQDFFSVQLSPYKIEFGHVCEDPNTWEQRYEKKDFKNHRDMGKVRWGDKKGGYGEHYWDLNHAGHNGNYGDDGYDKRSDDESYHEDSNDPYDDHNENSPSYGAEDYNPESSSYEDSNRAKRAHPKIKVERKHKHTVETYDEDQPKLKRKQKEPLPSVATHSDSNEDDKNQRYHFKTSQKSQQDEEDESKDQKENKKQVVLVVSHKDRDEDNERQAAQNTSPERNQYVPYESGSGVRQHQHAEVTAAASVPRLFLEPSTGHVIDRATGQAYVLQPITKYN